MSSITTSSSQIITIDSAAPRTSGPVAIVRRSSGGWLDRVRLAVAILLFLLALLTIVPAPVYHAWLLGLVASEGGHWLAPVALLPLVPGWRGSRARTVAVVLGLCSAALFVLPVVRAVRAGPVLQSELERTWGAAAPPVSSPLAPRQRPIGLMDLYAGIPVGEARVRTLVYADDASGERRLDLYLPTESAGPAPLLVVVHGGGWRTGDRTELPAAARYFAARGMAVAVPDYRLAPEHRFPAARDDVLAAAAYLRSTARAHGIDRDRVVFLGRSAGAQLAVSAAMAAQDSAVRGAVSLYGPLDLEWGYANPGNPRVLDGRRVLRDFLGGTPQDVPAVYAAASPIVSVSARTPPVLLIHGGRDDLVSPEHSERFAARMEWAGRPHYLVRLPWATHGCDAILRGPCGQIALWATERFLASVLR